MDAKKCDRCGEFYDAYNAKNYTMQKRNGGYWDNVDLCPRCYEDFVAFMKNRDMVPIASVSAQRMEARRFSDLWQSILSWKLSDGGNDSGLL